MTPAELKALSEGSVELNALSFALQALWADAHGKWDDAHELCQRGNDRDGDWVHAYLHRKEGDVGNAGYWYSRSGRKVPASSVTLDAEWAAIVNALAG